MTILADIEDQGPSLKKKRIKNILPDKEDQEHSTG